MSDILLELENAVNNEELSPRLEINIRSAILERDSLLVNCRIQIKALTEKLNDWSEDYRKIINYGGCPDEIHCSCVPALREEIEKNKQIEQERAEFVRKTTGSPSLEHFIVRYGELLSDLGKAKSFLSDEILPYLNRHKISMNNDPLAGLDLRNHPKNYAMREKSPHYPKAWEGRVPKTVMMRKTVFSDLPYMMLGGDFVCEKGRCYQVISNRYGSVSAWVGPGDNDFLGLKPDEFEIVEWYEVTE